MIVTLRSTTSAQIAARLVKLRQEGGVVALGRVMTLIVMPDDEEIGERAIRVANSASQEHPARIIVVQPHLHSDQEAGLDAQIRVGGDAGASEVVVLRPHGDAEEDTDTLVTPLLLSDAPIVAWWPGVPRGRLAETAVGRLAQRRLTYSVAEEDGPAALRRLAEGYTPGDTDLAWAGITLWRGVLTATIDESPHEPVSAVRISARAGHPSALLLAGWLADALDCPATVTADADPAVEGISLVEIDRPSGMISISRPGTGQVAMLSRPGRPDQEVNLARRGVVNSLLEDLRRLDEDRVYARVLREGVPRVSSGT